MVVSTHTRTSFFGATVTSWIQGGKERMFLSSKSTLDASKPVSPGQPAEVGYTNLPLRAAMLTSLSFASRSAVVSPLSL
jgi:hypothetical protein